MTDQGRAEPIDREAVVQALQGAWNDFVSDTGCIPDCFTIQGPRTTRVVADFSVGNFAEMVAGWIGMGRQAEDEVKVGWWSYMDGFTPTDDNETKSAADYMRRRGCQPVYAKRSESVEPIARNSTEYEATRD